MKKIFLQAGALAVMMSFSCSGDSDDDQDPDPIGGDVSITNVPDGVFWDEELTITGTGFSTVKEENIIKFINLPYYTCPMEYTSEEGGDIEILSATATQLKIRVPLKRDVIYQNPSCGPLTADIEVTVKDKKAVFEGVTFGPLPYVDSFLYHYGWLDVPKVTRVGDSVMLDGGLRYTPLNVSEYWDDVRLSINGISVPIKFRSIGLESGWAFFLPAKDFAEMNCSEDPDGWGAREMEFKIYIEGTDKSASANLFVQYLPEMTANCFECPSPISKSNGGNPEWIIKGKNMYYTEVRFSPLNCDGPSQGMAITLNPWTDELTFGIPLSILEANCSYGVTMVNECDSKLVANIAIAP